MAGAGINTTRVDFLRFVFQDQAGPEQLIGSVRKAFPGAVVKDRSSYRHSLFGITVSFGEDKTKWPTPDHVEEKLAGICAATDVKYEQFVQSRRVYLSGHAL